MRGHAGVRAIQVPWASSALRGQEGDANVDSGSGSFGGVFLSQVHDGGLWWWTEVEPWTQGALGVACPTRSAFEPKGGQMARRGCEQALIDERA